MQKKPKCQTSGWTIHGIFIGPLLANWFVSKLEAGLLYEIEPKMTQDMFTTFLLYSPMNSIKSKIILFEVLFLQWNLVLC